jgi:transposase
MRGDVTKQASMLSLVGPEQRVPKDHPIRRIKGLADAELVRLSPVFEEMYGGMGRPSIPPETLLKSCLLIALFSVRSERQFCERLDYDLMFRYFLDMNLDDESFDASTFAKNKERLLKADVARLFFEGVVRQAREARLMSTDHFTVDGTLIEAWASLKSFRRKDKPPSDGGPDDQGMVDFRGERRSNATHESPTDPEAKLLRKSKGKESKLCFGGHALMENRHGLCVDLRVSSALEPEPEAARQMLTRQAQKRVRPTTLGADKGYHTKGFVACLRARNIVPHIAQIKGRYTPGLDARTTRHASYAVSQRKRKRVEEIFGWMKSYGGLRKTMFRGVRRVQLHAWLVGAAYNLLRISRLRPLAP